MESSLYRGRVRHSRTRPISHMFTYRVFYGMFDIDRLADLAQRTPFLSIDRFNLFGLHQKDHGPTDGTPLRPWAEHLMSEAAVDLEGGKIFLLAFPRILGYAFNPISEWYCYGPDNDLRGIIHEVRNTFGDRHAYVVSIDRSSLAHTTDKMLHVSPFNDMDQTYSFVMNQPGADLHLAITQSDPDGVMFAAEMDLHRMDMSGANLLRLFFTHPLLTFKVTAGIHWQALRLWVKGVHFHRRPLPPHHSHTIVSNANGVVA